MTQANDHNNDHITQPPAGAEAPLQALYPNLDKVSRSSFKKGTVSRKRINISLWIFAGACALVVAIVIISGILL
jgi:hypothetical protein